MVPSKEIDILQTAIPASTKTHNSTLTGALLALLDETVGVRPHLDETSNAIVPLKTQVSARNTVMSPSELLLEGLALCEFTLFKFVLLLCLKVGDEYYPSIDYHEKGKSKSKHDIVHH